MLALSLTRKCCGWDPSQALYEVQGQQVKQEGVEFRQAGHDAPLGLLLRLAHVLHIEGAQELDHHLARLLAPPGGQEDLVQESVQLLQLLPEHLPGGQQRASMITILFSSGLKH